MRLKKVEISGFKSFLDKTKLVFQPGITAIVGPNGCGKSNIVDAILWAMGEQSAKTLRGCAMEDVIFSGSEAREPVGMAEVNLVFDISDGGPVQFAGASEMMITRRLYRNGESEYLINKTQCRLKDILELFMDTGVGTKAYSIIPQGKIDQIVNAKPEELRTFLEEAAGISKYKARKKAAQRKLEATQENLTRLNDIIAELERQLTSLERQAKKAQRYKEYKAEMRDLELGIASQTLFALQSELEAKELALRNLQEKETTLANNIESEEARLESDKLKRVTAEKELQELTEKHFHLQARINEVENAIELKKATVISIQEQRKRAEEDINRLSAQVDALEVQIKELGASLDSLAMEVASSDADLEVRNRLLAESRDRLDSLKASQNEMVKQHSALSAALEGSRQALKERLERLEDFEARLGEKKLAKTLLLQELDALKQTSFDFSRSLDDLVRARDELKAELNANIERLKELKSEREEKENRLNQLKETFNRQCSRFDSLKELEANMEGYEQGVRSIMLQKEQREGIYGLVADIFHPAPEYEKALEAVLGPRLQYIIVQSHENGMEAIDYLKTHASGRGSFVPLTVKTREPVPLPPQYADKIVGEMMELVDYAPEYSHIVKYLIGDAVVVKDLKMAIDLWRSNGHQKTLVTLEGEVVDPVGIISGGEDGGAGILEKRREMRELEQQIASLKSDIELAEGDCRNIEEKIKEAETQIEEHKSGCHEHEMQILRHEKELERYRHESQRIKRSLEDLTNEEAQLVREGEKTARRIEELKDDILSKESALRDLGELISKGAETIRILEEEIQLQQKTLSDLRVDHASATEKLEALENNLRSAISQKEQVIETRKARMTDIARGAEDIRMLTDEIAKLEEELKTKYERASVMEKEIAEKRDAYERDGALLSEIENRLKESRRALNDLRDQISALNLACNELSLKIENLVSNIDEKYEVDLFEVCSNYRVENYPIEENRERVQRLKELIARMGEVNLTAITEHEEIKQRYDFLTTQRQDILNSIEDLNKAIQKINRTCRERFKETFEAVNENFKVLFPRLFKGGRAYLEMEENDDILEAGVSIIAQPPGKKLQNMTLLSGGEKAMTAVALIFSLFMVKPTPFCLLDEVDSPLDDANIDRFNDIIREMSKTSQFVIITHNRRTMELADTLYGVTMQQKGVSKLISVKFNEPQAA